MNVNGSLIFLSGMAAGALVGILYAPQRGVRTRAKIKAKAKQGQALVAERAAGLHEKAAGRVRRGTQTLRRSVSRASEALQG